MGLVTLESQPDFPRADISDSTAAMLELLLLNRQLVTDTHASAERGRFLYRQAHEALERTAAPHLNDRERELAFSLGIATFEAIATMVSPAASKDPDRTEVILQVSKAAQLLDRTFMPTLVDATDKFHIELPHTHQVIGAAAARFCRGYQDYTHSGAAMAREFELQTTRG